MPSIIENEIQLFVGKVVSFTVAGETLALKNIKIQNSVGRKFLVGNIPEGATRNDWAKNRPCAISWDDVSDYIIFENEPQYITLMAVSEK